MRPESDGGTCAEQQLPEKQNAGRDEPQPDPGQCANRTITVSRFQSMAWLDALHRRL
jgi:hypothetical protein